MPNAPVSFLVTNKAAVVVLFKYLDVNAVDVDISKPVTAYGVDLVVVVELRMHFSKAMPMSSDVGF
jgi:hypothetical protein